VDRDHATPLALLLSELVTNACKYAPESSITVGLRKGDNGRATLIVRDSGGGIDIDRVAGTSMGMRLIRGVVAQMDGTHSFRNEDGAVFEANIALATGGRTDG
jgi:two-component sensor histidine kinase